MRKKRVIYFNDARHYYLFVFEPPMKLEDAWVPVDEAAGTSVDTFAYGVNRGDGIFYPSKTTTIRFGEDKKPFEQSAYWRVWHNMQSLMDRGLDPLTVLVDRAHDKGMDFIASVRMTSYGGMDPAHSLSEGGGGLAHKEVRDHQLSILRELAYDYEVQGVEMDLALPGGSPRLLRKEDVPAMTPVMTEYIREASETIRGRPGGPAEVGVRVLPTEAMNLDQGLDVRTWLSEGLVDFVVPVLYVYMLLDPNMAFDWLIEAAHDADTSVYGMLQPYVGHEQIGESERMFPTTAHMRAGAANFWDRGVDGLYTWFMKWPLGDTERSILTEIGDPEIMKEGDKHYAVARRSHYSEQVDMDLPLPVEIASSDTGTRHGVPFYISDDIEGAPDRISQITLKVNITDLVSADRISLFLNGESLAAEPMSRDFGSHINFYNAQWLEFRLEKVRPRKGDNLLEIALDARADGLVSPLVVEKVELIVEYSPFPSGLG